MLKLQRLFRQDSKPSSPPQKKESSRDLFYLDNIKLINPKKVGDEQDDLQRQQSLIIEAGDPIEEEDDGFMLHLEPTNGKDGEQQQRSPSRMDRPAEAVEEDEGAFSILPQAI